MLKSIFYKVYMHFIANYTYTQQKYKVSGFLVNILKNAFQYLSTLIIYIICEISDDNIQEKLPWIFLRDESYLAKLIKSDNKLVSRMSKS